MATQSNPLNPTNNMPVVPAPDDQVVPSNSASPNKLEQKSPAQLKGKSLLQFPDTDAGNAEAFQFLYGKWFRYEHTRKKWLVWNGRHWMIDKCGEVRQAVLQTARARRSVAASIDDPEMAQKRVKQAFSSESVFRRKAALESAQSIPSLATTTSDYDQDPFLLTVANGTLDLRTGKLRQARQDDLITRATEVPYKESAKCPRWLKFLGEVFSGDQDLIDFVWRAVGYSLTGDTQEQCFFLLHGNGANGKTTFLEILLKLLGTHAQTASFSTFTAQVDRQSPRNDIAGLHGARFVKAAESEQKVQLAEAVVKQVTGGDTISARFLYGEFFEYKPQFKLWLATNHKPVILGTDHAIWRRIRFIPFHKRFKGKEKDPKLMEKLEAELPGILAWAVMGCLDWQQNGLGEAPSVSQATDQYRRESDPVGRFIERKCKLAADSRIGGSELYSAYSEWCDTEGEKPLANNLFSREVVDRGIRKTHSKGRTFYLGIEVIEKEAP